MKVLSICTRNRTSVVIPFYLLRFKLLLCQYHSVTLSIEKGPSINQFLYSINSLTQNNTCCLLNFSKESVSKTATIQNGECHKTFDINYVAAAI